MGHVIWNINDIVRICNKWQQNKFDGLIVFDGNRGLSKSSGSYKLALRFPQFKIKNDLVFDRKHLIERLNKKNKIIWADELINIFHNREHWAKDQIELIKMLNMFRDNCNILIGCVPNFYDLDKQFRGLVKMRINCIRRGVGIIHTKNQTSFSSDKWDLANNEKVERNWSKSGKYKPFYKKLTTYRGLLKFNDVTELQRKLYEKLKEERRGRVFMKDTETEDDKTDKIIKSIIVDLIDGKIKTEKDIVDVCILKDKKYTLMKKKINDELKNSGRMTTVNKLLKGVKDKDKELRNKLVRSEDYSDYI